MGAKPNPCFESFARGHCYRGKLSAESVLANGEIAKFPVAFLAEEIRRGALEYTSMDSDARDRVGKMEDADLVRDALSSRGVDSRDFVGLYFSFCRNTQYTCALQPYVALPLLRRMQPLERVALQKLQQVSIWSVDSMQNMLI